jgi:hypothetical protein
MEAPIVSVSKRSSVISDFKMDFIEPQKPSSRNNSIGTHETKN